MMRVLIFTLIAVFSFSPAQAGQDDPRLDRLFLQLKDARTEAEIGTFMGQIADIWAASGSDTIDLLMQRAEEAKAKGAPDVALELLDRVVSLAPRYAEAWRRRGAVQAAEGNGEDALGDLREALKLEPRHFGALNEAAQILEEAGDPRAAAEALRRLSEIIPYAEGLRQRLLKLQDAARSQRDPI